MIFQKSVISLLWGYWIDNVVSVKMFDKLRLCIDLNLVVEILQYQMLIDDDMIFYLNF